MGHGPVDIRRSMQHVGRDNDIELVVAEPLSGRVLLDIEPAVLNQALPLGEFCFGLLEEAGRNIGVCVLVEAWVSTTVTTQGAEDRRGGAAGAGANFEIP